MPTFFLLVVAAAMFGWQSGLETRALLHAHTQPEKPRIAVLDFTNGTIVNAQDAEVLRRVLGMTLAGALGKSGQFDVVERQQLAAVLQEQELSASGRIDEATAARAGKILGAQFMLLGTFMVQPNREMQITTRVVEVSTGVVSFAPEVIGDSRGVTGLMNRLAQEVAKGLKVNFTLAPSDNSRLRPEMMRLIDALARACDQQDSTAVVAVRRDIEAAAPGHPALSAPCLR